MKNAMTVEQAEAALAAAHKRKAREDLAQVVALYLGGKPLICNALIEGCTVRADVDGVRVSPIDPTKSIPAWINHQKPRRTPASLKRQAAKMRAYWRKKKAGKK